MTFQTANVLGSIRGIGRALVKRLAWHLGQDANVYLTARSEDNGQRTVTELATEGTEVEHLVFDLADPAAPQRVADKLKRRHGGVDIAVKTAQSCPRPAPRQPLMRAPWSKPTATARCACCAASYPS